MSDVIARSLRAAIARRRPSDVVAIDDRAQVTAAQLIAAMPASLADLGGRSVAIMVADPLVKTQALVWLDGWCRRILLIPAETTLAEREQIVDAAGVDATVTDGANAPGARVVRIDRDVVAQTASSDVDGAMQRADVDTEWVIPTTGTTGAAKLVVHTLATLTRTTKPPGNTHPRWGLLYDVARFAGLQVFLQAVCGAGRLLLPDLTGPLSDQLRLLARAGCDSLSATPTLWRRILMTAEADTLRLKRITLGGEIAEDKILRMLGETYPEASIRHIYASTDAGVGFSVADRRPGFPAHFLDTPPPGVEVRVRDGRLFLRPSLPGQRYLSGPRLEGDDGFIDTGDLVARNGDRFLFVGRASGIINVGGNKVVPEEVERVLLAHPSVALARVYALRSPIVGAVVAAEIVPGPSAQDVDRLKTDVLAYCRAQLPAHKVPAKIVVISEPQPLRGGKIVRHDG